jgi:hypothetical protein
MEPQQILLAQLPCLLVGLVEAELEQVDTLHVEAESGGHADRHVTFAAAGVQHPQTRRKPQRHS